MQERVRLLESMYPGRIAFNTPSAHRLRGPFDYDAFAWAFRAMVARQPALRTEITAGGEVALQRVLDEVDAGLPIEDLSVLPIEERESQLIQRMERLIEHPIALGRAPLFRVALYRLAADEHVFFFMAHHIVWDGWSFDLLYREMAELYSARLDGREAPLPPLQVTYLDYARWCSEWLQGRECAEQVAYWRNLYAGLARTSALPTDRERPVESSGRATVEWIHVGRDLTEALRGVAARSGATLNMLLMGAYSLALAELTASRDIVLGIPVRGRSYEGLEDVMGFFINLLPLPVEVPLGLEFGDFLRHLKSRFSDALQRQDVPFHRLLDEPAIARLSGPSGLYHSLFSFQDARDRPRTWGPLQHSTVLVMQRGATEDLGLWLMEVPTGLEGGINVNPDIFDATTASLFKRRLLGLLERVAVTPHWSVDEILRDAGEDRTMLENWIESARGRSSVARERSAHGDPAAPRSAASPVVGAGARIAAIWADLLGVDVRGIRPDDNFFDLGGNSLLVMQAVVRMEKELGIAGDPRRYVHETLAQLAAVTTPVAAPVVAQEPAPSIRDGGGLLKRLFGRKGGGA